MAEAVPLAVLGTVGLKGVQVGGTPLVDPKQVTLISLGLAVVAAYTIGLPLIVQHLHGDPVVMAAIGMRSSCRGWRLHGRALARHLRGAGA